MLGIVLTEDAEYNSETFPVGTYEVPVDGKYWTGFDRMHPLEGPARDGPGAAPSTACSASWG